MVRPVRHRPTVREWEGEHLAYRIDGDRVPTLTLTLDGVRPVFFEHHLLLWKEPGVELSVRKVKRGYPRSVGGLTVSLVETVGGGTLSVSRERSGQVVPMHLRGGMSVYVREHQVLAATAELDLRSERHRGASSMFELSTRYWLDRFDAFEEGVLWLYGYGDIFHVELGPGESLDVEPAGWLYYETGVGMEQQSQPIRNGLLAGTSQVVVNRFVGPGTLGLQSGQLGPAEPEE